MYSSECTQNVSFSGGRKTKLDAWSLEVKALVYSFYAEPDYDYSMTGLMLSFEANSEQISTAGEKTRVETQVETRVEVPLKTPDKILAVLADTPDVSLAELAYIIDKSVSAVERAVAKLVSDGRLRHVGPKKGGRWEVLAVRDKAQNTDWADGIRVGE